MKTRLTQSLVVLALGLSWLGSSAMGNTPPNVVILLADDLTWTDIGAYGATHVATPHIDQLAGQGMRFTHAFTATAMCAPTRQQLYTGLFPVRSGAFPNHAIVKDGTRSMVHALRALGYRVGLSGKTHFGPASAFPFEIVGSQPAADGGPDDVDFAAAQAFMARDRAQPFALVLAFNEPHEPWTQGDVTRFDPDTLHVPANLVNTPQTRAALRRYYAEVEHLDHHVGTVLKLLDDASLTDNTLVLFTSEQGAALPFAKWTLYDAGVRTAFIARWPGRVPAGQVTDALVQYVDVLPTLVHAAGGAPGAEFDGRSFLPVLTGAADTHNPVVFGVHTNRGIIHGVDYPIRSVRDPRYKLIWNLQAAHTYANIRTEVARRDAGFGSWVDRANAGDKWAQRRVAAYLNRPEFELYDMQRDPLELDNLAGRAELRDVQAGLFETLKGWMRAQGDGGIATERQAAAHMNPEIVARIRARFGDAALPR